VNYTIADQQYSVFGWTVTMHRTAEEFSTLEEASAQGFALAGSGSGTVVTARVFKRRKPYLVSMSGREGTSTQTIAADREGRLHIEVPLGPPNPYQQDTPEANAAGTAVYATSVSIARARHHRGATP
jgi:hypothetical protein